MCRQQRDDAGDAEHDGVADHLVHPVTLEHGLRQGQRERQLRRRLGGAGDAQHDAALVGELDARAPLEAAAVEDLHLGARCDPQHPHEVPGLVVVEGDGLRLGGEIGGEEAGHC